MREMNELREQKSILAKLMATENITVRHAKIPTAGFDPKSRTLLLPILKEMEGEVYDLFVCHEIGHALYTPADGWHRALCEEGPNYKGFLNIVEDARIEKLVKNKYHGAAKSMHKGYQILMHDRDFFGINKLGLDINETSLIDKLNIHFKGGPREGVRFTEEEMYFVQEMEKLETWNDVEQLTEELYEYCKGEEQQLEDYDEQMTSFEEYDEDEDEDEEDSEEYDYEYPEETSSEENPESEEQAEKKDCEQPVDICDDSKEKREESEEAKLEQNVNAEKSAGEKKEEDKTSSQQSGRTSAGGEDAWYDDDPWTWNPKSITDEEYRSHEAELVHEDAIDIKYYNSPKMNLKDNGLIFDYKSLIKEYRKIMAGKGKRDIDNTHLFDYAKEFLKLIDKDNKPVVNYLAKEFEMKKRASEYKRSMTSNSGMISLSDIHKYKYSDNIFKKVTIVPEGKNHGLYMLIDWSGSMHDKMMPTFIQLLQLMDFCRKCSIKHEVYAFVDYSFDEQGNQIEGIKDNAVCESDVNSLAMGDRHLQLIQIFSDKMSARDFRDMREFMILTLLRCDRDFHEAPYLGGRRRNNEYKAQAYGKKVRLIKETKQEGIFNKLAEKYGTMATWEWQSIAAKHNFPLSRLCGTPLNDAIMYSIPYCNQFKKDNKLDIVNTVILTDGESNGSYRYFKQFKDDDGNPTMVSAVPIERKEVRNKLVDRDTKKVFDWHRNTGRQETKNFLEYYKYKTSSNVCGFFLCTSSDTAAEICTHDRYGEDFMKIRSEYNKNGFVVNTDSGYSELYVIKANKKVDTEDEINIDTDKKQSTSQMARAFKKFQKGKLEKRVLLNRFTEMVS